MMCFILRMIIDYHDILLYVIYRAMFIQEEPNFKPAIKPGTESCRHINSVEYSKIFFQFNETKIKISHYICILSLTLLILSSSSIIGSLSEE